MKPSRHTIMVLTLILTLISCTKDEVDFQEEDLIGTWSMTASYQDVNFT